MRPALRRRVRSHGRSGRGTTVGTRQRFGEVGDNAPLAPAGAVQGLGGGEQMSESVIVREVVVRNRLGLHARASAQFVKTAGRFRAEITVEAGSQQVNGKSIMGLLLLAAAQGTTLRLRAAGADASQALEALAALVEGLFGEIE